MLLLRHTPRTQQPSVQLLAAQQGWLLLPQGWQLGGLPLPALSQTVVEAVQVAAFMAPVPEIVPPGQQACVTPPQLPRHTAAVGPAQVLLLGSQQPSVQRLALQQLWPAPPQATQLPLLQILSVPQVLPSGTQTLLMQQAPPPQVDPGQQALPGAPQLVHVAPPLQNRPLLHACRKQHG